MAILAERPMCHKKQPAKHKLCFALGVHISINSRSPKKPNTGSISGCQMLSSEGERLAILVKRPGTQRLRTDEILKPSSSLVEMRGVEPLTCTLRTYRSPN
jgi:hypothetical protein